MEAPLQAYTQSGQASRAAKDAKGASSRDARRALRAKPKGKSKSAAALHAQRFRRSKDAPVIAFDDENRRDYLTGFRKRKKERIEKTKAKYAERAKEELKAARKETREARKQKAAENVRMEEEAYGPMPALGALGVDGAGLESDGEEDDAIAAPTSYDTPEHFTSVTVSSFDPSDALTFDASAPVAAPAPVKPSRAEGEASSSSSSSAPRRVRSLAALGGTELPPSSARAAKRAKSAASNAASSAAASRSGGRTRTRAPAGLEPERIVELLEPEAKRRAEPLMEPEILGGGGAAAAAAGATFHYESKAERAQERTKIREKRQKMKEKRMATERNRRMSGGKEKKKKDGKRGIGGKGKPKGKGAQGGKGKKV